MPIDTLHPALDAVMPEYEAVDDILAGERHLKKVCGTKYVPPLDGHGYGSTDSAYKKYLDFGVLYNAFERTVQGLSGAIMRKPPTVELPTALAYMEAEVSPGLGLVDEISLLVRDNVSYGRAGILVDVHQDGRPYLSHYGPRSVRSWVVGPKMEIQRVILSESSLVQDHEDAYNMIPNNVLREAVMVDGRYMLRTWGQDSESPTGWIVIDEIFPQVRGRSLEYIPFTFVGAVTNTPTVKRPPLGNLLSANFAHWRLSVDYHYGLHLCAMPTPVVVGFPALEEVRLGPGSALISSDPMAKASFLEFTGGGLGAIVSAMERIENQMAILGARLLEDARPGVEAAETVRLRSTGDSATLSTIAVNTGGGLERSLRFAADMIGADPDKVKIGLNRDFAPAQIDPQTITALLQALQANAISQDTFLQALQNGEIVHGSVDDEKARIEASGMSLFGNDQGGAGGA